MHAKFLASSLLAFGLSATTASAEDAPVTTNNDSDHWLRATLPEKDNTTVRGEVTGVVPRDRSGLNMSIYLNGIPEGQELSYHIHENPVPEDGNCYATGGHLDPYNRGDEPPCDPDAPQTCEVGDLSGKHGPFQESAGEDTFIHIPDLPNKHYVKLHNDAYLSNVYGTPAFIGNRSVVVHASDGSRVNCGNFEVIESPLD